MAPETELELAEALGRLLGAEVVDLRRLSGGASRETWSFTAVHDDRREPLILQRTRPGLAMGGPSMAVEDTLLAAAERAGVPVPPVVADVAATTPVLGVGRVTAAVDGEALGPRIVRDPRFGEARRHLAGQCARALAAVHSIDVTSVPGLAPVDALGRLRDGLDGLGEARPAFELALRWLHANQPPSGEPRVVHGDFRLGNLLVDERGLRAVLDWELAHLGDPLEDLGWLCVRAWRFGGHGEVGGVAPLDELLDAYAEATGAPVDPAAVRWWIVAGTLTWGLICAVQARRHLDGHVRSVELATIGRRVSENEYDLLQLLGVPPVTEDGPGTAAGQEPGLHGRPTAAELVEAVRDHLAERVAPEVSGATAFHLKVAGNALAIAERELRLGPAMAARAGQRLAALGFADEAALAAAIRAGSLDGRADVAAAARAIVVDRVRVANPRWLQPPDAP